MSERSNITEQAVLKATGWTWDEWFALLDKEGAQELDHKGITKVLREEGQLKSGWWQQMVTVEYERARGLRKMGETAKGFEVTIRRTFEVSPKRAWDVLMKPIGQKAWLEVMKPLKFVKGEAYETTDGTTGEIRTVRPGSHVRLTWRPMGWTEASTLQVSVINTARVAVIVFQHEQLPSQRDRENVRKHWGGVLDALGELL
jgi:uncharacterized protein YndB with AHSA1/START domain